MERELKLTWDEVYQRLEQLDLGGCAVYGVPRGGAVVAGLAGLQSAWPVSCASEAQVIVDDIIDSGATQRKYCKTYPGVPFKALVNKYEENLIGCWVRFPWEAPRNEDLKDHVKRIIEAIGDDPRRLGLLETPRRVVDSWTELYKGYSVKPDQILKWFDDPCDEMVIVKHIAFWSTCEHHMLPFWGTVDLAYIPKGRVVGISKFSRLVEVLSRKLQVQERLVQEIGRAIDQSGHTQGVAVSIRAQHACMAARGVKQQESTLVTNYLSGAFKEQADTRAEFFTSIR